VLAFCLGAVQVVAQQVRMTDAAADGARSLARGDDQGQAAARVHTSVAGAAMSSSREGEFVCVRLDAPANFAPAAAVGVSVNVVSCALAGGL
jgi:Flp pilus assembly protein TadG